MIDGMKARDLGPRRIDAPSARRLVEDAVEFAAGFDFRPHSDFRSAKLIFGDIDASAGQQLVEMGKDGKPFYISGPYETECDSFEIMSKLSLARDESMSEQLTRISDSADIQEDEDDDDDSEYEFDVEDSDGASKTH